VIKTYVALGLGVGIIAEMAFDPVRDEALAAMPVSHLFEGNTTRIGFRRDIWLRGYEYDFIELLAPQLTRRMVEATLKGEGADPGL
jgi:LysR family cys regulon transcriptional activator